MMFNKMARNFKKEIARDLISFGSIPFFLIILARAFIGPFWPFISQLVLAFVILFFLSLFFKKCDLYSARSLILVVFTSIYYQDLKFTVFASLIWILILLSLIYQKIKFREIATGVIFGAFSSAAAYYIFNFII